MQLRPFNTRLLLPTLATASMLAGIFLAASCKREERPFNVQPPNAVPATATAVTDLVAGGSPTQPSTEPARTPPTTNAYEENAWSVSEGKRLYELFNCVGCHAHGGGGMGPPLMDNQWVYGAEPDTVFQTIIKGRPNGMPSFAGKIPDAQVWEIVSYVRSMSGQLSANTSPSRTEDMSLGSPENSRTREKPVKITPPPDVLPSAGTFTFANSTATAPTSAPTTRGTQ